MNKPIKYLLVAAASLAAIAVLAVVILFVVVDPNRYKPALTRVLAEQTGLEMSIAGDIAWTFRPVFGLSIADVRLRNGDSPQELASFSTVSLKVTPGSILNGPLQIEEFVATNLNINWIVDSNGQSNWQLDIDSDETASPAPASVEQTDINAEIQQISLLDARISIQDASRGLNTTIEDLNLISSNTNFSNRPFPFELSFLVIDSATTRELPVVMNSTAAIDLQAGTLALTDLEASLSPLNLTGELSVNDFNQAMSWRGQIQTNSFNLFHFMEHFTAPGAQNPVPGNIESGGNLSMNLNFNGDADGVSVPQLRLQLDDMQIDADIEYRYASGNQKPRLAYTLASNALDLDAFTGLQEGSQEEGSQDEGVQDEEVADGPVTASPEPSRTTPADTAPAGTDIEIPVELLNSMNVVGNHNIESLKAGGLQFGAINLRLTLEEGVLDIETQPIAFYEGQLVSAIRLDSRQATPALNTVASLENIDMLALAGDLPFAEFATGRLNTSSQYTLGGLTLNSMLESMTGSTSFALADNSVDISMLKQVFTAISALSPSGDMGRDWPDTLSFQRFDGSLTLTQGLASGQELALRMDNFDVAGTGGIDLATNSFDYDLNFTVLGEPAPQTIPLDPTYQGIAWPVNCAAAFDAPASQYCGPNFEAVRTLFGQIARNEVERRVEEAVSEQVPENLLDSARGLLRNLFRR